MPLKRLHEPLRRLGEGASASSGGIDRLIHLPRRCSHLGGGGARPPQSSFRLGRKLRSGRFGRAKSASQVRFVRGQRYAKDLFCHVIPPTTVCIFWRYCAAMNTSSAALSIALISRNAWRWSELLGSSIWIVA
ncbi:hypothetical protein D3C85_575190 [compost metagenome]